MARRIQVAATSNRRRGAAAGAVIATPVEDTFTDTNGTVLTDHTPEVSPGGVKWVLQRSFDTLTGTTIDIESNRAECQGDGIYNLATIASGISDCLITSHIRWPNIGTVSTDGVAFRYVDEDNYWWAGPVTTDYNWFRLLKVTVDGNALTQVAKDPSVINTDYKITVRLDGDSIIVELDDEHTITTTDSHCETSTLHGIQGYAVDRGDPATNQYPQFDDFEVARL